MHYMPLVLGRVWLPRTAANQLKASAFRITGLLGPGSHGVPVIDVDPKLSWRITHLSTESMHLMQRHPMGSKKFMKILLALILGFTIVAWLQ